MPVFSNQYWGRFAVEFLPGSRPERRSLEEESGHAFNDVPLPKAI